MKLLASQSCSVQHDQQLLIEFVYLEKEKKKKRIPISLLLFLYNIRFLDLDRCAAGKFKQLSNNSRQTNDDYYYYYYIYNKYNVNSSQHLQREIAFIYYRKANEQLFEEPIAAKKEREISIFI